MFINRSFHTKIIYLADSNMVGKLAQLTLVLVWGKLSHSAACVR